MKVNHSFSRNSCLVAGFLLFLILPAIIPTTMSARTFTEHDRDLFKEILLDKLVAEGWERTELKMLKAYLNDERAEFRTSVVRSNIQHVETHAQYEHQVAPASVQRCIQFLREKGSEARAAALGRAVPLEVITAILKVESNFGKYPPPEAIFNVYWSLAVSDDPRVLSKIEGDIDLDGNESRSKLIRRASWGRRQLRELIAIGQKDIYPDLLDMKGSWAGAFGLCQFIPSSYNAYAVDGNGDGIIDLWNVADAAASIAEYLERNGWRHNASRVKQKKALMRYNHSEPYADSILILAEAIRPHVENLQLKP